MAGNNKYYQIMTSEIDRKKLKVATEWISKLANEVNALNEIFADLNIRAFSYEDYYIDEIDNQTDYARVTEEILPFDEADKEFFPA